MRRKPPAKPAGPVVSPEILEQAKRAIPDKAKSVSKCTVCGAAITEAD
jgi:hypothetical protein